MLRPLGLEKGKPFKPDARQTKILSEAVLIGEAMAKANSADRRFAGSKFRADAHWDFALQLDADNPDAFWDLLDERASWARSGLEFDLHREAGRSRKYDSPCI